MFESIWSDVKIAKRPSLNQNLKTEVAVIGGGMAGSLIAYSLKKHGKKVVVLDSGRIGQGMTLNTTAKITSQHNIIYQDLIQNFGVEKAREYATYNQRSIEEYERIINELKIECDFQREDSYVYTLQNTECLKKEVEAARTLGIDAEFTTETALPFSVEGAVRFSNQANFHPFKFLKAVAEQLDIYEESTVERRKGEHTLEVSVKQEDGSTKTWEVEAEDIVIANHYPFEKLKGFYAARMYQERENIIVAEAPEALLYGMYVGAHNTGFSFRKYKDYLIVAGQNHRPGLNQKQNNIEELEEAVMRYYKDAKICYRMANQDCMTLDKIPYIGHYTKDSSDVYIATGFNKWGMSHAMVSAMILTEMICFGDSKEESIYNPGRFDLKTSKEELKNHMKTAMSHMIPHKAGVKKEDLDEIQPGQGAVITNHGYKIAVYREKNGTYHSFLARCPHLGCLLEWNQQEKSWDCPCHGSRFHADGRLMNGPANEGLSEKQLRNLNKME